MPTVARLHLETSAVRLGEKVRGELVLPPETPGLEQARRVVVRALVHVEYTYYFDSDSPGERRHQQTPGAPEFSWEGPLRGGATVPFELTLTRGLPPSHPSQNVYISWEVQASLYDAEGRELHCRGEPLQVGPGRAEGPPREIIPSAPRGSPWMAASTWGCLTFPALFCFFLPIVNLVDLVGSGSGYSLSERVFGILFCLVVLAGGIVISLWLISKARTYSKLLVANLEPLAKGVPLGAVARMRVFLTLTAPFTTRGAKLELSTTANDRPEGGKVTVPVKPPAHLRRGLNQFDVELPIPRSLTPSLEKLVKHLCTLTIELEGHADLQLHARLVILPEELDPPA
jgi:hypothetical protein